MSAPHPEMWKCQAVKSLDAAAKFRRKQYYSICVAPLDWLTKLVFILRMLMLMAQNIKLIN